MGDRAERAAALMRGIHELHGNQCHGAEILASMVAWMLFGDAEQKAFARKRLIHLHNNGVAAIRRDNSNCSGSNSEPEQLELI